MFKKILLPLDGSEMADRGIASAVELARLHGSEIVLLRATRPPQIWPSDTYVFNADAYRTIEEADNLNCSRYLEEKAAKIRAQGCQGVQILPASQTQNVAHFIAEEAERLHADLIILSSHGRKGMDRFIHGSVAENVARNAHCPVLLVPS
jgi:nucleotide-binding universal stress UspA family protein